MFPHQIIYQAGISSINGVIFLRAPAKIRLLYALMQTSGIFVVGLVLYAIIYSFTPVVQAEVSYATSQILPSAELLKTSTVIEKITDKPSVEALSEADATLAVQKAAKDLGVESHFSVVVPKINAKSNIVANVDPGNEKEYTSALKQGVAHAKATYFPGQGKLIYLFSHSTNAPWNVNRYSAVFYLLKKLEKDDKVVIFFADKKYEYKVVKSVISGPSDISWLNPNNPELGSGETLVLQTCTPAGTNLKRLLIIAKPV